jgi:hypothetical protein
MQGNKTVHPGMYFLDPSSRTAPPTERRDPEMSDMQLKIFRVNALPAEQDRVVNSMYLVKGATATEAEMYLVGKTTGEVRHLPTGSDIDQKISTSISNFSNMTVVADITARDAQAPTRTMMTMVIDATGDSTVNSGSAIYVYDTGTSTWYKTSEVESMDMVLNWSQIVGGPNVTAAQVEAAVSATHTHANLTDLDKVATDGDGYLTYNNVSYRHPLLAATPEW